MVMVLWIRREETGQMVRVLSTSFEQKTGARATLIVGVGMSNMAWSGRPRGNSETLSDLDVSAVGEVELDLPNP